MNDLTISWNILDLKSWEAYFNRIPRTTLLQSYAYARAVCPLQRQRARWGLIKEGGEPLGLVQIQEAGVFKNLIHALILDRGPLWFEGADTFDNAARFFHALNRQFPARPGRRRRILPELADTDAARAMMAQAGFTRRMAQPGYRTIWLDITPEEEILRQRLHQKWRNALNKSERAGLSVEWDEKCACLDWLLIRYGADSVEKGYPGPSMRVLKALSSTFGPRGDFKIARAINSKGEAIAGILVIRHGLSATYQVGWTSKEGREVNAHHFLLWQSVLHLKQIGVHTFDLGGIDETTAQGVSRFKKGMGGDVLTLAGQYG